MSHALWKWTGRAVPAIALTCGTLALASGVGAETALPAPTETEFAAAEGLAEVDRTAVDADDWTPMRAPASPSRPNPTKAGSGTPGAGSAPGATPPPVVKQKGRNKPNKKP